MRLILRILLLGVGLPVLLSGVVGLGHAYAPESSATQVVHGVFVSLVGAADQLLALGLSGDELAHNLSAQVVHWVVPAVGLVLILAGVWPRRSKHAEEGEAAAEEDAPKLERSSRRRAEKQVKELVKKGDVREAAELYLTTDQLDKAVELYVQCGDLQRAAEIRHDQNRFEEAAEFFAQAGRHESAATLYADQGDHAKAAEMFVQAGRKSMAGEAYEKAGQNAKAAECFQESGFARHAAQAWVRCQSWRNAATCLEEVISEEGSKTGIGDTRKDQEVRKLVLQCGKLWEQADDLDKAAIILERGGVFPAAAEVNVRLERFGKAAELYQRSNEPLKAADALRRLGEDKAAEQLLGEYHRDRGDDEEAARAFEAAGDSLAAGDLYRKLQEFAKAGECFHANHDSAQAAEMFRLAGEPVRAATCYEDAQRFVEAAECFAEGGDLLKQAELLVRAEHYLAAGEIFHREGDEDQAIKVLQKIEPGHADLAGASAILGRIFKNKGMYSLSIKKLRQALGDSDLEAQNIAAFYELALVYDANRQFRDAVDLYEKILACDYHYSDVEDRLDAGREKLRLQELNGGALDPGRDGQRLVAHTDGQRPLPDRRRARPRWDGHRLQGARTPSSTGSWPTRSCPTRSRRTRRPSRTSCARPRAPPSSITPTSSPSTTPASRTAATTSPWSTWTAPR